MKTLNNVLCKDIPQKFQTQFCEIRSGDRAWRLKNQNFFGSAFAGFELRDPNHVSPKGNFSFVGGSGTYLTGTPLEKFLNENSNFRYAGIDVLFDWFKDPLSIHPGWIDKIAKKVKNAKKVEDGGDFYCQTMIFPGTHTLISEDEIMFPAGGKKFPAISIFPHAGFFQVSSVGALSRFSEDQDLCLINAN